MKKKLGEKKETPHSARLGKKWRMSFDVNV